jgi:hypothetical protein
MLLFTFVENVVKHEIRDLKSKGLFGLSFTWTRIPVLLKSQTTKEAGKKQPDFPGNLREPESPPWIKY